MITVLKGSYKENIMGKGDRDMWREEMSRKNPMRIFEKCIHGGLGQGNMGVIMARAGVGKTACLIQISLDNLFKGRNVLHFSRGQEG